MYLITSAYQDRQWTAIHMQCSEIYTYVTSLKNYAGNKQTSHKLIQMIMLAA
jgi:hypothetical protein